jgi:hypothetical protein
MGHGILSVLVMLVLREPRVFKELPVYLEFRDPQDWLWDLLEYQVPQGCREIQALVGLQVFKERLGFLDKRVFKAELA